MPDPVAARQSSRLTVLLEGVEPIETADSVSIHVHCT